MNAEDGTNVRAAIPALTIGRAVTIAPAGKHAAMIAQDATRAAKVRVATPAVMIARAAPLQMKVAVVVKTRARPRKTAAATSTA